MGTSLDRRLFLRSSAALGLGALLAPTVTRLGWAASNDRLVIYQGVSLDSLHPYGYSGGGIGGIWRHMIEPLIQMDVGINVELVSQENAAYWGKEGVNGGKLPFYYAGSNGSDAGTFFDQYFRTGGSKRIAYSNPEFDKLIEEEQRTGDHKKRVAILQ